MKAFKKKTVRIFINCTPSYRSKFRQIFSIYPTLIAVPFILFFCAILRSNKIYLTNICGHSLLFPFLSHTFTSKPFQHSDGKKTFFFLFCKMVTFIDVFKGKLFNCFFPPENLTHSCISQCLRFLYLVF